MSALEPEIRPLPLRNPLTLIVPAFAGTLFTSALLLFTVQPMFAKMVLPLLGGSPSVWSVAMVFFQAMLLIGYGYAHILERFVPMRAAITLHLIVLMVAFASLPIALGAVGKPPQQGAELWLVGLFLGSVGLPFFAVSATAPLLQAWFARGAHAQAADPYFLYGASNLGSFAALMAYPLAIEPWLTLHEQSALWTLGFAVLAALIVVAGLLTTIGGVRTSRMSADATESAIGAPCRVTVRDRLTWIVLAFVPSALLIAITSHITTDIAAAPFLWVIPLALFLATFVFTFREGGERLHAVMLKVQPFIIAALAVGVMRGAREFWMVAIVLDLGMLFVTAMVCHRALYLRRPDASHLTSFYMWVSLGGVLGGIACGLVAPHVFPDVWEYPILIVLALTVRPGVGSAPLRSWVNDAGLPIALALAALVAGTFVGVRLPDQFALVWNILLVLLAALVMLNTARPVRMIGIVMLMLTASAALPLGFASHETTRSFFGVHKVADSADGRFRLLYHGTTLHGAMRLRDNAGQPTAGAPEPLTYYYRGGALSETIAATRERRGMLGNVAIVGLGAGALACHMQPGENLTYFEIDPEVVRIARDATKFRFIADCAPRATMVLGDARLTLAEDSRKFDMIVLDAFSSDVIPTHLMTREAMAMYLDHLAPGGVIALHISNRYLELAGVVRDIASSHGLATFVKRDATSDETLHDKLYARALVAAVARNAYDLAPLRARDGWVVAPAAIRDRVWTDDYTNIPGAIWRMMTAR